MDRCGQCMKCVDHGMGYQAGAEVLCAACYFVLWGPAARPGSKADEMRRPRSRREQRGRTRWVPGPLGELDLGVKVAAVAARRRRK
jgi:hypothetical protein